ncbi:MAG: nucleotide exchange factor GrpE [Myxococcota bacterium]|nr:nucleotide exchange factor GrpE [Myxococcota bacterium]
MASDSDSISRELERLRASIEQQNETSRRSFDALYEELRQYKEDFIFQSEKPLLLDLLLFYDSLNWFQQSIIKGEMSPEVIADSFQYLIDEFLELLYRRDVLPMETRKKFDRENQKALQVVPTNDPKQDYVVKRVLKRGFSRADRKLRAEEVIIHRHSPAASDDKR